MTWFAAGAAITVAGGVASSRASGKAADKAAEGQERAGAQIQAAGDRASAQAQLILPQAQGDILSGAAGAVDVLGQGITEQQRLLSAGNLGAQQFTQQGFDQTRNALLGIPVDQQAFAPQEIGLSEQRVNPIGQALGGGQVQGGLFSNLAETTAANAQTVRRSEEKGARIANLVERAAGSLSDDTINAQRALIDKGFNFQGEQLSPSGKTHLLAKLDRERNERLQTRAKRGDQFAIDKLKKLGLDIDLKPL